jgi:hypothetical protein
LFGVGVGVVWCGVGEVRVCFGVVLMRLGLVWFGVVVGVGVVWCGVDAVRVGVVWCCCRCWCGVV